MRRIPGSHEPNARNRSSKHLTPLTKVRSIFRCMSNAALAEMNCKGAAKERARRAKKNEKNDLKTA